MRAIPDGVSGSGHENACCEFWSVSALSDRFERELITSVVVGRLMHMGDEEVYEEVESGTNESISPNVEVLLEECASFEVFVVVGTRLDERCRRSEGLYCC